MKLRVQNLRINAAAWTLIDMLVVIAVLAILAVMLLPTGVGDKKSVQQIRCVNNLKQIGQGFHIWAGENNEKYPMEISVTNGGTMEWMNTFNAWKTFQVMSNELYTPKVLLCPKDSEHDNAGTIFGDDLKDKISYFIGVDTTEAKFSAFLSGDDNFILNKAPAHYGLINAVSDASLAWDTSRHSLVTKHGWFTQTKIGRGNVCLGDGSVLQTSISDLTNLLRQTGLGTNRFAIP